MSTPVNESTAANPTSFIADPGPLGLAGFAMTTFILSVFNAHILDASLEAVVLPVALFYGGIAQVLAGMWEFKKNNTFGALAFTSYGAFWLSFAALVKFIAAGLPPATAHQAVGLYLLSWTIFTLYMTIASAKTSGAVFGVFIILSADVHLPGDRRARLEHVDDQGRRLPGDPHGHRRLVRLGRRRDQRHLEAHGAPDLASRLGAASAGTVRPRAVSHFTDGELRREGETMTEGQPAQVSGAQVSEAQIAVHWREEEYYYPPAAFVEQANAQDPAILDRFSEEHFPECFTEYADLLSWDERWHTVLDTSQAALLEVVHRWEAERLVQLR